MSKIKTGLHIVITNAFIDKWSGSELYVRDVALELIRRGHKPVVYSQRLGKLADLFRLSSIPVVKDLNSIKVEPDLIHGQHHLETMTALARFPDTPAVYFCHGWLPWEEIPPLHPRILKYVTVSDALRDRLIFECGIPAEKITTILNFVDMERFRPRLPLPAIPRKVLVFSSDASESNFLSIVQEACARGDMIVDAIGYGSGNPSFSPEAQLGNYDLIFARGRAALESLAVGTALVCCGLEGMGQMATTKNLHWLRRNNFGIRVLNRPITADTVYAEIQHYDPVDALKVSRRVRATAGLTGSVDQILGVYAAALNEWAKKRQRHDPVEDSLAFSAYLMGISDVFDQNSTQRAHMLLNALERAVLLQNELNAIKSKLIWRLYERVVRIKFVYNLYVLIATTVRRWLAHGGKKNPPTA